MDIVSTLTLMISFGMLVAFIMSDRNHKKITPPMRLYGAEGLFLPFAA